MILAIAFVSGLLIGALVARFTAIKILVRGSQLMALLRAENAELIDQNKELRDWLDKSLAVMKEAEDALSHGVPPPDANPGVRTWG